MESFLQLNDKWLELCLRDDASASLATRNANAGVQHIRLNKRLHR
jgi:hypothetical protein